MQTTLPGNPSTAECTSAGPRGLLYAVHPTVPPLSILPRVYLCLAGTKDSHSGREIPHQIQGSVEVKHRLPGLSTRGLVCKSSTLASRVGMKWWCIVSILTFDWLAEVGKRTA